MELNHIYHGPALDTLKTLDSDTVDCMVTDPPYGYSFMNRDWDKAVIPVETWRECLRVLKPGSFACIMSSPRQDVLSRMIVNLQDTGFRTDFTSIYWTYASGFPKASNISKMVDKRGGNNMSAFGRVIKQRRHELGLSQKDIAKHFPSVTGGITGCVYNWEDGKNAPTVEQYNRLIEILQLDKTQYPELEEAEREIIGQSKNKIHFENLGEAGYREEWNLTKSATEQAKTLDGSYGGYQPKPAIEIILMVMKPLSEKTFVDQALKNGKGITWLDDCKIPYQNENDRELAKPFGRPTSKEQGDASKPDAGRNLKRIDFIPSELKGRFSANVLVSDDVLNDGRITKSTGGNTTRGKENKVGEWGYKQFHMQGYGDTGSYSRYFDLDRWFETTFPFIITPKPSPKEKNMGLDRWIPQPASKGNYEGRDLSNPRNHLEGMQSSKQQNFHPTVKSIKLMCYLISLVSRPNDIIMDPFMGSGTTAIAAQLLKRRWIGMETNKEYIDIANQRII